MRFPRCVAALVAMTALFLPVFAAADEDDPVWLTDCRALGTSTIECLSDHLNDLQADQENDIAVLRTVLDTAGPDGTDYAEARAVFDDSQAEWDRFAQSDCRILDLVLGDFGSMGAEAVYCLIEHYQARNAQIERWIRRVE